MSIVALAVACCACSPAPDGSRAFAAQMATRAAAAPGAAAGEAPAGPAPLRTVAPRSDVAAALAALPADRVARPGTEVDRFVRTYFTGTCHADDRLAFDEVCEHAEPSTGDTPSPWPDLVIGLRGGGIASAVLLGEAMAPPAWSCMRVPGPAAAKACFAPATSAEDRARWMREWTAFFSAAG